ncbi:long-chain-alcohol oxidase FAO1-like [Corylus avellana]|uniref:long-chain-alcohol oxidase FAO1-like n=1 Tax=Corylus avellana TaxID=13451 RepID=UPI00286A5581|nr:long-chain-alcohol oxidase FAO1-like [Corylus avellana]
MRRKSHPLLRGGRRGESKYSHTFTAAEMQSLGSICETILPSLPSTSLEGEEYQPSNVLQSFCKASGSQTPIPDQVAELLVKRALKESLILTRVVLWLLATRLGTLLLCGSLCFCEEWPFIRGFSRIPLEKRELVLQKWSRSRYLTPIRCAFVYIKMLCLFVSFSQVFSLCYYFLPSCLCFLCFNQL